jgi:hypothetical protein
MNILGHFNNKSCLTGTMYPFLGHSGWINSFLSKGSKYLSSFEINGSSQSAFTFAQAIFVADS